MAPTLETDGHGAALGATAADWWLRTILVLQSPRAVFVALRDESSESVSDRAEPIMAIVMLSGIGFALSTRTAAHLLDDSDYDGLLVALWAFLAGCLYGSVLYWLFAGILHPVLRRLGSQGSFRRTRNLVAFAAVPTALSLVLWPVKLALYGGALFHEGGADAGTGGKVFEVLSLLFAVWAAGLLVVGVRAVHGWSWARAAAGASVPVALAVAAALL